MRKYLLLAALCFLGLPVAARTSTIDIHTATVQLILEVADDGCLYQSYLGEKLLNPADAEQICRPATLASNGTFLRRSRELCICPGSHDFFSPALGIVHADGNLCTALRYVSSRTEAIPGGSRTDITLRDGKYPVQVVLHYEAYEAEDVLITWSDISHSEKGDIRLQEQNGAILYFDAPSYYLTEYSSDWASEMRNHTQQLHFGKKIVDTKLGSRANLFCQPFFELGLGAPAQEASGTVLMGTIAYVGNWRYTMEVDNTNGLAVSAGANPAVAGYSLAAGQVFSTPQLIFTLSQNGTGEASRKLHAWAREYRLKDGKGSRMSLLNNWENTYFAFDEPKLAQCMQEAAKLGVDLFLLDDGWFGNGEDARNSDISGLGDWEVNSSKLPGGIPGLVQCAKEAGVKFGIWIEPEMVNPQSKLFRKHPDWVLMQPDRELYTYRSQLVLDLSNPKVQDYVFGVVEGIMRENPEVAFFKWDCNAPITNLYSPYEGKKQSNLFYDHARGVQNVMRRVAEAYPDVQMMLCSGGGGRCDYESLRYFSEFWCSDNTNPVERAYIQWNFSKFFPAKAMCAHVTSWNKKASVKFRTDMASMCKLGFDIGLADLTADELEFCRQAIANWKRLGPAIMEGEQYRLVSPLETNHMALDYVSQDKSVAVLFCYDIYPRYSEQLLNVKLQGLDPESNYLVEEINLMPGQKSKLAENGKVYSGDYLMKLGLNALTGSVTTSRVIELKKQ